MTTSRRKCLNFSQGVDDDHFYVQSFTALAQHFRTKLSLPTLTPRVLAKVALVVRQFSEEKYGRGTAKPRSCMKLPHTLFHNFSINGGLSLFFSNIFSILQSRNLTICDVTLENATLLEEIVKTGYAVLLKLGLIKTPIVFFNKVPVGLINTLSRIVTEHYGEVTSNEENATHIINWNDEVDNFPEELTEDFIRILETKQVKGENFAFVHWWYYPDCYDEWLSGSEVNPLDPPDISSNLVPKNKWNVCCRFILDCEVFNEWGNEIDYENDSGNEENAADAQAANAKKSRNRNNKKMAAALGALGVKPPKEAPILEATTVTEKMLVDLLPPSLCSDATATVSLTVPPEGVPQDVATFGVINAKGGVEVAAGSAVGLKRKRGSAASATAASPTSAAPVATASTEDPVPDSESSNKVTVRGPPTWYDANTISTLELIHLGRALGLKPADDLSGSSANNAYIKMRGLIVGLYELNTTQHLSVTECRRKMSGDVSVVMKVYEFLNAYNIINYGVKSECRSQSYLQFPTTAVTATITTTTAAVGEWDDALRTLAVQHKGDWQAVSSALSGRLSPHECAARFALLTTPTQASASVTVAHAAVNKSEIIHSLNQSSWLVGSDIVSTKAINACVADVADLIAKQNVLLQKYMENRFAITEEKLKLLANVENLVEIKREELEIERKDLQIHGAQLASVRNQNAPPGQITV